MSDAFEVSGDTPRVTREQFHDLNRIGSEQVFGHFRSSYRRWQERVAIRQVSPSQYVCLSAIVSRTLVWNKIAEIIPLSVFRNGLRHEFLPELLLDPEGMPFFSGTGLNFKTIRSGVIALENQGLIARFCTRYHSRDTYVFVPFSLRIMRSLLDLPTVSPLTSGTVPFLDDIAVAPVRSPGERQLLDLVSEIRQFLEEQPDET